MTSETEPVVAHSPAAGLAEIDASPAATPEGAAAPSGKKKITERKTKPDAEKFQADMKDAERKVNALKAKMDAISEKMDGQFPNVKQISKDPKVQALRDRIDAIRARQVALKDKRAKLFEQLKQFQGVQKAKFDDMKSLRDKIKYRTIQDCDTEYRKLEQLVESGQLRLVEEKKALGEMSLIKKAKRQLEEIQSKGANGENLKLSIESIKAELDSISGEFDQLQAEYDRISTELNVSKGEINTKMGDRKAMLQERDAIYKELSEARRTKTEVYNVYKRKQDEFYKYMEHMKVKRQEEDVQRREEKKLGDRRRKLEELRERAEAPAFVAEIFECDNLIKHFESVLGGGRTGRASANGSGNADGAEPAAQEATSASKSTSAAAPPASDKGGAQQKFVVVKKKALDDMFAAVAKPKKKSGAGKGERKVNFNLSLGLIQQFSGLNMNPPQSAAEIPATIEALQKRKDWYAENRAAEQKRLQDLFVQEEGKINAGLHDEQLSKEFNDDD